MSDMADVIVPKSDQWNADDFIAGPKTFTIRDVQIKASEEQPVNILLEGSNKAFRPCKSMSRCLVSAWGSDAKKYVGRSLTLYRDPTVKWGGLEVGGIRISHMSDIDAPKQMMLTATRGSRKPHKVLPLTDAPQQQRQAQLDAPGLDEANATMIRAVGQGTAALEAAWRAKGMAPLRDTLQPKLDAWKSLAAQADAENEERAHNGGLTVAEERQQESYDGA